MIPVSMTNALPMRPFDTTNGTGNAGSTTNGTSGSSGASGTSSGSSNQLTGNSFLQLLTAQLQAQDPTNPVDPTTFVTQLVEFNQLQQLIDINQTLAGVAAPSNGNSGQGTANSTPTSNAKSVNLPAQWAI
jgi:flagellar basal-body rod modification protein FlgD